MGNILLMMPSIDMMPITGNMGKNACMIMNIVDSHSGGINNSENIELKVGNEPK